MSRWLDQKYPTAPYHFVAWALWACALAGTISTVRSHFTGRLFDLVLGLVLTVASSCVATLATVWARNEIESLRRKSRKSHPSFPFLYKFHP